MSEVVEARLKDFGLAPDKAHALQHFLNELFRWNRVHNLTAIDETEAAFNLHLIDSIVIFPILQRYLGNVPIKHQGLTRIADLGSGGGLPAIPLAILEPDWSFTLVEASRKKAAFLQHIRGALALKNTQILPKRVEALGEPYAAQFDAVTARAFTRLKKLLDFAKPLLKSPGLVFAMKSQRSEEEISELTGNDWSLLEECALSWPGQSLDRRLLVFQYQ
jgi:16S rRNA (guanine527-N7)-methyltransferase